MTEKYTPPTEYIRSAWAGEREREFFERDGEAEFDRALAEHDRQVAERAWREGAQWAAVECDAITTEDAVWIAPGENPYREDQS